MSILYKAPGAPCMLMQLLVRGKLLRNGRGMSTIMFLNNSLPLHSLYMIS